MRKTQVNFCTCDKRHPSLSSAGVTTMSWGLFVVSCAPTVQGLGIFAYESYENNIDRTIASVRQMFCGAFLVLLEIKGYCFQISLTLGWTLMISTVMTTCERWGPGLLLCPYEYNTNLPFWSLFRHHLPDRSSVCLSAPRRSFAGHISRSIS